MPYDSRHNRRSVRWRSATPQGGWWAVAVACLGMTMSFLTITATITALSAIEADLQLDPVERVWVASAYTLAVAALVLSAGALGDRYGRRTVFSVGTAVLGVGAILTAAAGTPLAVVLGEVVMGAGAALVVPNSLAIASSAFPEPARRAGAVGVWAACSGIGLAVGPLSAGLLLRTSSWHAVFLVDVVVAVVVLVAAPFLVPNAAVAGRRIDLPGTLLATTVVTAAVLAVIEGGRAGYAQPLPQIAAGVALLALVGFVLVERRAAEPVVDPASFRSPQFVAALAVATVALFTFTGTGLLVTLLLQRARGADALTAGVELLALMAPYVLVSWNASRVVQRLGVRRVLVTGLAVTGAGSLLTALPSAGSPFAELLPGLVLTGSGLGLLIGPTTAAVLGAVPPTRAGSAITTVTTLRQFGAALGGPVLGTLVAARLPGHLDTLGDPAAATADAVRDGLLVVAVVLLATLVATHLLLRPRTAAAVPAEDLEGIPT